MLAHGYSSAAAQVAAKADSRMDNLLNAAAGIPYAHYLTTSKYQNRVNPQHGERGDHQSREMAQAAASQFISTKIDDAVERALQGDIRSALIDIGQASHTAQDIVRHEFETGGQHPVGEATAMQAEKEAAEYATGNILSAFEGQVSWRGMARGLTGLQINVIMNSIKDPLTIQLTPMMASVPAIRIMMMQNSRGGFMICN